MPHQNIIGMLSYVHTLCRPPSVTIPNMNYALLLLQDAFVISIVTFAVTISLAKVFAKRYSYSVDSNQVQVMCVISSKLC